MTTKKKRFFAKHAKSSAALVSLAIHGILFVVAITFVAVTVVQKEDQKFEAKPVNRPKMQLKRLQVPVNVKKKTTQKPKLRKRIVVKPQMNKSMPDIKMPEISGVKGGLGNAAAGGLGGAAALGFNMPEIEVFGAKSKGEKLFFILDSREFIMYDEVGGIAGYTIIKDELHRILEGIPPTALFNVAVFDTYNTYVLFPQLVSANGANVKRVEEWLKPLNAVSANMKADDFGPKTLGEGGIKVNDDFRFGKVQQNRGWYKPCAEAMKQQADTVFLLTSIYGWLRDAGKPIPLGASAQKKYDECYKEALKLLDEENKVRLAKGEAPRAINRKSKWEMNKVYFPDIEFPRNEEDYWYTYRDFGEAFLAIREKYRQEDTIGRTQLRKKSSSIDFSLNVVQFLPNPDAGEFQYRYDRSIPKYKEISIRFNGQYSSIKGLEGIKEYTSTRGE